MAGYDSDSSGDDNDFTETNILLGYAANEPSDDTVSHLGGHPVWIDGKTAPSGALAKCKVCNGLLTLLLEINGELPDRFPGHERRLCIFSCRRKTCRRKAGSVRGIRGIKANKIEEQSKKETKSASKAPAATSPPPEEKKPAPLLGNSLFGATPSGAGPANPFSNPFSAKPAAPTNPFSTSSAPVSNPFSTGSKTPAQQSPAPPVATSTSAADLPETFASKARISSPTTPSSSSQPSVPRPHEPWPDQSTFPAPYPNFYLDAGYETLDTLDPVGIPANTTIMDLDEPSASGSGSADDRNTFESTIDKTFQRFADRLAQNPEQVLRYEFGGSPLLYSREDAVGRLFGSTSDNAKVRTSSGNGSNNTVPRCTNCGAARLFELQLTPHAITELEADEEGFDGMEWGTIILAVCGKDCTPPDVGEGEVGYVEEWVGVQWEEVKGKVAG